MQNASNEKLYEPCPEDTEGVLNIISSTDRVLDVGGGYKPFNRANVVIDWLPYDRRGEGGSIGPQREYFDSNSWIQMDICGQRWPFRDLSFDFVYCGQVLEDVRDPLWVCNEIQRVGKKGFIAVPSIWIECQFGIDCRPDAKFYPGFHLHRWYVEVSNSGLVFIPKLASLAHLRFVDEQASQYYRRLHRIWIDTLFWEDAFRVELMRYPWIEEIKQRLQAYFDNFDYGRFDRQAKGQ